MPANWQFQYLQPKMFGFNSWDQMYRGLSQPETDYLFTMLRATDKPFANAWTLGGLVGVRSQLRGRQWITRAKDRVASSRQLEPLPPKPVVPTTPPTQNDYDPGELDPRIPNKPYDPGTDPDQFVPPPIDPPVIAQPPDVTNPPPPPPAGPTPYAGATRGRQYYGVGPAGSPDEGFLGLYVFNPATRAYDIFRPFTQVQIAKILAQRGASTNAEAAQKVFHDVFGVDPSMSVQPAQTDRGVLYGVVQNTPFVQDPAKTKAVETARQATTSAAHVAANNAAMAGASGMFVPPPLGSDEQPVVDWATYAPSLAGLSKGYIGKTNPNWWKSYFDYDAPTRRFTPNSSPTSKAMKLTAFTLPGIKTPFVPPPPRPRQVLS